MPNLYASLYALRVHMQQQDTLAAAAASTDTADDARMLRILESVSRTIDQYCGRRFFVETRTRYYGRVGSGGGIRVDDLLSVTTLKTDEDGDRVYEVTWATTDYDLEPANALYESPPQPYTRICPSPLGDYSFPSGPRSIEIVGSWGFSSRLRSATTLNGAISSTTATTFTAASGAALSPGETILVDSEQMYISGISTNTVTVERGVNGTTAATHLTAATVSVYEYPPQVVEACLFQAERNFVASNAPGQVSGVGEFQQTLPAGSLFRPLRELLDPLRRVEAA